MHIIYIHAMCTEFWTVSNTAALEPRSSHTTSALIGTGTRNRRCSPVAHSFVHADGCDFQMGSLSFCIDAARICFLCFDSLSLLKFGNSLSGSWLVGQQVTSTHQKMQVPFCLWGMRKTCDGSQVCGNSKGQTKNNIPVANWWILCIVSN